MTLYLSPVPADVELDDVVYFVNGRELVGKLQRATTSQRDAIRNKLRTGRFIVIDDYENSVGDFVRIVRRTTAWAEWIEHNPQGIAERNTTA
jgi:hypothetical protein